MLTKMTMLEVLVLCFDLHLSEQLAKMFTAYDEVMEAAFLEYTAADINALQESCRNGKLWKHTLRPMCDDFEKQQAVDGSGSAAPTAVGNSDVSDKISKNESDASALPRLVIVLLEVTRYDYLPMKEMAFDLLNRCLSQRPHLVESALRIKVL
jgi:hypothetical protein